ncbi:MAG: ROK family protein [Ruminococcaceae bacterium]|nr:ROK family protein [Oscillospiraceae bacterium]
MYYLGFDIGGTKSAVCLGETNADGTIRILGKEKFPTTGAPYTVLDGLIAAARRIMDAEGIAAADVRAAGISCGGPLSSAQGVILSPPNLPGWDEIHAAEHIQDALGIPAYLENDANACAAAEWLFGAGRGTKNMIFLTFGTGLGAGLILDGRLYRGTTDSAGEIGHVRLTDGGPVGFGVAGSCEGWCSGGGIARLARMEAERDPAASAALLREAGSAENISAANVAKLANAGDPFCRRIYEMSGEKLGQTLAILSDILDVERIVIGSVFARSENLLRPAMERVMRQEALRMPEVVPAQLGESIGDMAALAIAVNAR